MTPYELIKKCRALGASDLHMESGSSVFARVQGEIVTIGEGIAETDLATIARDMIGESAWRQFHERNSADHSTTIAGVRCRINVYRTIRGIAAAIRLLSPSINDVRACNLHPDLSQLTEVRTGLVIVSGPTGSGKSTTLAALIEEINATRAQHIITLESPIEYLYSNRRSFIRQREIPTHSPSYEQAITDALRENPDVLVIGEMRTPEVMRLTLNAAETGHLVLATMHSATCAEALSRLCMSFPSEIQDSVRGQLADCLIGVVSQRLRYLSEHRLHVPHCEILRGSSASRGTIRVGQFSQIATVIQSGGENGMWSFDRYERWMMQKKEWIIPKVMMDSSPEAIFTTEPKRPRIQPQPRTAKVDDSIEISIDEDIDLQEIAKQIDEGKF